MLPQGLMRQSFTGNTLLADPVVSLLRAVGLVAAGVPAVAMDFSVYGRAVTPKPSGDLRNAHFLLKQ
jgi:hypothetical protein